MLPALLAAPDEMLTMRPHCWARMCGSTACGAQKRRLQVDGNSLVEVGLGEIVDAAAQGDACIVDQYIDRSEITVYMRNHCGNGRRLRDVGLRNNCAAAQRHHVLGDALRIFSSRAAVDGDIASSSGQSDGDGATDAP